MLCFRWRRLCHLQEQLWSPRLPMYPCKTGAKRSRLFRQVRVDILGLVENMGHFACPHCHKDIDIFSHGGGERTARQFGIDYLVSFELDPRGSQGR